MGEARDVGQAWFDAIERGDSADQLAALLARDVDFLTPVGPISSAEEAAGYIHVFIDAFPDAKFNVTNWIEDGQMAVAEGRYTGTHTGDMAAPQGTIPATGRSIDVPYARVFQVKDGKLTGHRAYWDNATFMTQLGLMPGPDAG
jgi:steroid delta-isomerase-like uncharacterized protein